MASVTTAQVIIDDAEEKLIDTSNDRWDEAEHLLALNNGMKEICIVKPDAYVVTESVVLVAGVTQSLPTGGFQLMEITHNMGVSPGTTPGKVIRLIERKILDAMDPNWRSATASAVVDYYLYDERIPLSFSVSPKQPASGFGYVEMSCAKAPTEIAIDAVILVPDIYRNALFYYVLSQAYLKDIDFVPSANKATAYYQAFLNILGIRQKVEEIEDPGNQ
jgi:hypothetical protein